MPEEPEPDFKRGDQVESLSGFFRGRGEVLRNVMTRFGWYVEVAHEGGTGEVKTLCSPKRLRRVEPEGGTK